MYFKCIFYEKLFNSDKNSKIQDDTKLTKKTVEILLNELFSLDDQANETKIEEYASNTGKGLNPRSMIIINFSKKKSFWGNIGSFGTKLHNQMRYRF